MKKNHYVLRYINKNKIVYWYKQEFPYVAIPAGILYLIHHGYLAILWVSLSTLIFARQRAGKPSGYINHYIYSISTIDSKTEDSFSNLIVKNNNFPNARYKHIIG
jgi:hypothetical protein